MTDAQGLIRADVAALAAYRPGGSPASPDAIKLSSNENPFPPLESVLRAARDAAAKLPLYPDNAATELAQVVAARHGIAAEQLAFGAGSVSSLMQVLQATCRAGEEVIFAWRSFEANPLAATVAGAVPVQVPLRADGTHDIDAMLAAITGRTRAILLASPNNPTGPVLHRDDVVRVLEQAPEHILVVLDEAYVEYVTDSDAVDGVDLLGDPRLVVLRTLSKAWGLAGYRVGYAMADPQVAAALRTVTPPFSVSIPAQATALAALAEEETILAQVATVTAERDRVAGELRTLGFQVPQAQGNFVWLDLGERAEAVAEVFADHGLVVRTFAGEGCRITTHTAAVNDQVLAAARAAGA